MLWCVDIYYLKEQTSLSKHGKSLCGHMQFNMIITGRVQRDNTNRYSRCQRRSDTPGSWAAVDCSRCSSRCSTQDRRIRRGHDCRWMCMDLCGIGKQFESHILVPKNRGRLFQSTVPISGHLTGWAFSLNKLYNRASPAICSHSVWRVSRPLQ